jgi:LytS/YehU family sensor histidine kinase
MIIKLSEFLRYAIGEEKRAEITFEEEVLQIDRYLDIEKIRFGDKLICKKKIARNTKALKIPKLILQPIFENAIKYGVYESLEPVIISIESDFRNGFLQISISNNFEHGANLPKGEGIGLKNISQRLEIRYGIAGLIKYKTVDKTFVVNINIPQISKP